MKTNYTAPKLFTAKGDISKDWYVYFYYDKKRYRYKLGINFLKTKKERQTEANAIISALTIKLESGWNPQTNKNDKRSDLTLSEAISEILDIKKSYITQRTYKTYYDQTALFTRWLESKKYDKIYCHNFTPTHARQYLDWLLSEKRYCGKTYNGHLTCMRTFFNAMIEREIVKESPFAGIKMVRADRGKNTTYSPEDETKLIKVMQTDDPHFYLATRIVRYCFLRRSELVKLQVKHIKWESKTIIIPSENAKSRVQDSVTIPKTLEKILEKSGILSLDPDTFMFGNHGSKKFAPGMDRMKRVDNFSDKQRAVNRANNIRTECTFYSWKHTGVTDLYNHTKDVYIVMRQCRHTDIKMTMIYLRSLGCGVNEQVRDW